MKKIAIISCSNTKLTGTHAAKDLYSSQRFMKSYQYAKSFASDIFILSAKYGLIHEDDVIDSYDVYYKNLPAAEKIQLQRLVEKQIGELAIKFSFDPENDLFVVLSGMEYLTLVSNKLAHIEAPIAGLPIGKSLQQLKHLCNQQHNQLSDQIHHLFNQVAQQHKFDGSNFNSIGFKNGIYVFFEKGQSLADGAPRIVRIGTHTGDDNLISRIRSHYKGTKESSIFRKNIGLCMLKQAGDDDYMDIWKKTTSQIKEREKIADKIDKQKEAALEERISKFLADNFYLVAFEVANKEDRLRIETGLISALAYADNNKQNQAWLGNFSTKTPILESGMWLVRGIGEESIGVSDLQYIENYFSNLNVEKQTWLSIETKRLKTQEPKRLAILTNNTNLTEDIDCDQADDDIRDNTVRVERGELKAKIIRYMKDRIYLARLNHNEDFTIVIRAGDLGSEMRLSNRIPAICNAMRALMKVCPNSSLVNNSNRDGTNFYIEYTIPANEERYQQIFNELI